MPAVAAKPDRSVLPDKEGLCFGDAQTVDRPFEVLANMVLLCESVGTRPVEKNLEHSRPVLRSHRHTTAGCQFQNIILQSVTVCVDNRSNRQQAQQHRRVPSVLFRDSSLVCRSEVADQFDQIGPVDVVAITVSNAPVVQQPVNRGKPARNLNALPPFPCTDHPVDQNAPEELRYVVSDIRWRHVAGPADTIHLPKLVKGDHLVVTHRPEVGSQSRQPVVRGEFRPQPLTPELDHFPLPVLFDHTLHRRVNYLSGFVHADHILPNLHVLYTDPASAGREHFSVRNATVGVGGAANSNGYCGVGRAGTRHHRRVAVGRRPRREFFPANPAVPLDESPLCDIIRTVFHFNVNCPVVPAWNQFNFPSPHKSVASAKCSRVGMGERNLRRMGM